MKALLPAVLMFFVAAAAYSQTAVVIGENAYLRGQPSETGPVVDTLVPNAKVLIIKKKAPWFLVQASPFVGWIHRDSIRLKRSAKSVPISSRPGGETISPLPKVGDSASVTQPAALSRELKYILGPRGGCYYLSESGRKVYVPDKGLCGVSSPQIKP